MNILYIILILLFFLNDLVLCLLFNDSIFTFRSYFWGFHFIATFVFLVLEKKLRENEDCEVFILLFPCIGYLILLLGYFIRFKGRLESEIEENISYEKYLEDMEKDIVVQSSLDLNLIGAYDILAVGNPKEKKDFFIGFETTNTKFKVEVLKKALWDKDIDVIHYAATEINKIDEKFQNDIQRYKKEENIEKLCKTYFEYSISGLLEGVVLEFYQNIILNTLGGKDVLTFEDQYMRMVTYKNMGNHLECDEIAKILLEEKWLPDYIVDFIKEYYYEENEIGKFKEVERWQKFV